MGILLMKDNACVYKVLIFMLCVFMFVNEIYMYMLEDHFRGEVGPNLELYEEFILLL